MPIIYKGFFENEELNIETPFIKKRKESQLESKLFSKFLYNTLMRVDTVSLEDKKDFSRNHDYLYNSISRLTAVLAMYFLEKGECYVKYDDIIKDLENAKKESRRYKFYRYSSLESIKTTIREALYELSTIGFIFYKKGNKIHYKPNNKKFDFTKNSQDDEYTELCIFDALVKYNGCSEKNRRNILNNATELLKLGHRDNFYIKSGLKPRFDVYTTTLEKLRHIVKLRKHIIKFKYKNKKKNIFFKIEDIIEYDNEYYIVGTELPGDYRNITANNVLKHYNISDISEIYKVKRKPKFYLYAWYEHNTELLKREEFDVDDPNFFNVEANKKLNVGKEQNVRICEQVDNYIDSKICKTKNITFELLKPDYNYLPKDEDELEKDEYGEIKDYSQVTQKDLLLTEEDIKMFFGDLIQCQKGNDFTINYNIDKFIKWAIPNYNCIKIKDEKLKQKVEKIIFEIYKNAETIKS